MKKKNSNKNKLFQPNVPFSNINRTTVMTLNLRTDRSGQTVQTQIRLLLDDRAVDQGLHCLLFHLHLFDEIP